MNMRSALIIITSGLSFYISIVNKKAKPNRTVPIAKAIKKVNISCSIIKPNVRIVINKTAITPIIIFTFL